MKLPHDVCRPAPTLREVLTTPAGSSVPPLHSFLLFHEDGLLGLTCLFLQRPGWHLPLEHSFRATGEVTQWGGEDKRIGARSSDTLRPVVAGTFRYSPKPSVHLVPHHPYSLTFLNVKSFTCTIRRGRGNWVALLSGQPHLWFSLFLPPFLPHPPFGCQKG